jgi:hypothetical protein
VSFIASSTVGSVITSCCCYANWYLRFFLLSLSASIFRSPQSQTSAAEREHLWKNLTLLKKTHALSFQAIQRKEEQLRQSTAWIATHIAAMAAKAAAHFAVMPSMTTAVIAAQVLCSPYTVLTMHSIPLRCCTHTLYSQCTPSLGAVLIH